MIDALKRKHQSARREEIEDEGGPEKEGGSEPVAKEGEDTNDAAVEGNDSAAHGDGADAEGGEEEALAEEDAEVVPDPADVE